MNGATAQARSRDPSAVDLDEVFAAQGAVSDHPAVAGAGVRRDHLQAPSLQARIDRFFGEDAACAFLRVPPGQQARAAISLDGGYRIEGVAAGGWLLAPAGACAPVYWIPAAPMLRRLDADGHILEERAAAPLGLDAGTGRLRTDFGLQPAFALDLVVWRFERDAAHFAQELRRLMTLETQPLFMWSSHTSYSRPADVYAHLVFGQVYENHAVWPRYWKVCSELDAWALYVSMLGLERATGKRLYRLLRRQLVCSVMARQADDGGWYHGEWTDSMESHFRLVAAGIQLLCAAVEDEPDPAVAQALRKAVRFVVAYSTRIDAGAWFLHDSMEHDEGSIRGYPFRWARSTALGKSISNMLVLNTHLDTTIAVDRYREVTGDASHADLVASAVTSAMTVMQLRTAELLYRVLFWAIGLTFLPTSTARALPLPQRAVKRLAWKYLIPRLHHVKARFPRFAMPGGFIDRAVVQQGCVVRYHPVNLMDIVRFERRFGRSTGILDAAFAFTGRSGLQLRWKEARGTEDDSLGFWSEALYHRALRDPSDELRTQLAQAVIDLSDNGLGLSPSLLGSNPEALARADRHACPSPLHPQLRIVNLSRGGTAEYMLVNPTDEAIAVAWEVPPQQPLGWVTPAGDAAVSPIPTVPARSWLLGRR